VGLLAGFGRPPSPTFWHLLLAVTIAAGIATAVGWRTRLSTPAFAAGILLVATYRSSWGQLFHTEHLLVLHALVLGGAWTISPRRRDPALVLRLLVVVTVATYVVSGWAKLRTGGLDWVTGDTLRNQIAYDNVRKEVLGSASSPFAEWLVPHAWLFPPLAAATLLVELGAPVALAGRRLAYAWAAAAWAFHLGVAALMAIVFAYPLSGVAFAPMLPVERLRRPRQERSSRVCFSRMEREADPRRVPSNRQPFPTRSSTPHP
jgi:hypothetical protein